jgi:hypothetical protein
MKESRSQSCIKWNVSSKVSFSEVILLLHFFISLDFFNVTCPDFTPHSILQSNFRISLAHSREWNTKVQVKKCYHTADYERYIVSKWGGVLGICRNIYQVQSRTKRRNFGWDDTRNKWRKSTGIGVQIHRDLFWTVTRNKLHSIQSKHTLS